ncbi:MAG: MarR family transcriptional regulator [Planctomycetes bacterium]|nr:MarR family transcriptional regulator [Planctomycetota bacterium]
MSIQALAWVARLNQLGHQLNSGERVTMYALGFLARDTCGHAPHTYQTIADYTSLNPTTAMRVIRRLVAMGLVEKAGRLDLGRGSFINVYGVLHPYRGVDPACQTCQIVGIGGVTESHPVPTSAKGGVTESHPADSSLFARGDASRPRVLNRDEGIRTRGDGKSPFLRERDSSRTRERDKSNLSPDSPDARELEDLPPLHEFLDLADWMNQDWINVALQIAKDRPGVGDHVSYAAVILGNWIDAGGPPDREPTAADERDWQREGYRRAFEKYVTGRSGRPKANREDGKSGRKTGRDGNGAP